MKATSNAGLGRFIKAGGKCRKGWKKVRRRVKGVGKRWMCVKGKRK